MMKRLRKIFTCVIVALLCITNAATVFATEVPRTPVDLEAKDAEEKALREEASVVFQEFKDAVAFIENDPSWYDGIVALLNQYGEDSINRNTYSQWYADYVHGGSVEEYFAMSSYEQFLWTESYTRLAYAVGGSGNFDQYFGDEGKFRFHVTNIVTNLMNGNDKEVVIDAYLKLMDWQYNYVKKNGVPYNFITNRNYIEEINQETEVAGSEQNDGNIYEDSTEVVEENEEKGVWSATFEILAKNAITILILVVLGVALAFVVHKRKEKNIDDER